MSDITELRGHLFDTLKALKDGSMEIDRAKAMAQIADTIIDTAKVEVDFIRVTGANNNTGFIPDAGAPKITQTPTGTKIVDGATTTHKLK